MKKSPEQLRILHLSTAKTWRGGEQQIAYLAEELRSQGIRQWIFCAKGSKMEAFCRERGFEIFPFSKGFSLNPIVAWRIRQLCRRLGITHLHAHDSHAHTFAVLASLFFKNNTPLIVHRRVDFPIGGSFFSKWKYNHPLVRRIVCVSHFIKKLIEPAIRDTSRLAVVHSGIDLRKFEEKLLLTGKLRSEFNVPAGEWLIANVAAIAPHKDYFTFVKTAEILLLQHFPARFFIIGGDGGEEAAIREWMEQKRLSEKIILTGFRPDVPEILPEIDLLLFTSKTEGLGTSLLDAMACGVPVVATHAGGIPEIVEDEVSGLLAPVSDAESLARQVRRLLEEPGLKQRLTQAAHRNVQAFSKEKMAAAILDLYLETS